MSSKNNKCWGKGGSSGACMIGDIKSIYDKITSYKYLQRYHLELNLTSTHFQVWHLHFLFCLLYRPTATSSPVIGFPLGIARTWTRRFMVERSLATAIAPNSWMVQVRWPLWSFSRMIFQLSANVSEFSGLPRCNLLTALGQLQFCDDWWNSSLWCLPHFYNLLSTVPYTT